MNLAVIGCSHHHTPIALRERLSFSPEQVKVALRLWRDHYPFVEAVLLSTCNRTELYLASEVDFDSLRELLSVLLETKGISRAAFAEVRGVEESVGLEAVTHLFAVASGLESMVVGEVQILGQVKSAYRAATDCGTVGSSLHNLFQATLRCAKRVHGETRLHQHRVSVPAVAVVDVVLKRLPQLSRCLPKTVENSSLGIFGNTAAQRGGEITDGEASSPTRLGCQTLILGAGEMADETLRLLKEYGAQSFVIVNRSRSKAMTLAAKYGGVVDEWENRFARLAAVDLAVCTTGAAEAIVTLNDFRTQVAPHRTNEIQLLILDLAVPRDIESEIAHEPNVALYSIDDLREVCSTNLALREKEIPHATRVVEEETQGWSSGRYFHSSKDLIAKLHTTWNQKRDEECARLLAKLANCDEAAQREITYAFERLVNKLLHPVMATIREESAHSVPHELVETVNKIFRLDEIK